MSRPRTCSECGTVLSADAPGGHCIRCILQLGLTAHENADEPVGTATQHFAEATEIQRIGRYKLLGQIGEGGCGVVYLAEQETPVRRQVALKLIKLGMDTRSVIARFEAERQALALMDHPNIARVFDGGATDTGRPFFVMEWVDGQRITDYCDAHQLSIERRLELFITVCQAVQHAHQKGIIHRDIKPSNILVLLDRGKPSPKVIDFGVAKAIDQRLTDKTLFTAFEQFVGTPAYMSPEQAEASSRDIDTRSDIYSLGVLLYELLTGTTPFRDTIHERTGLDALRTAIRETEPPRPSHYLANLSRAELEKAARLRQTEPLKFVHVIRGDLDWIVLKALEKDRARRYETADALAEEIRRFLANEPLLARPPGRLYRLKKLVRRNTLAFSAAAAVGAVLLIGLSVSLTLFMRVRAALHRAVAAEMIQTQLRAQAEQNIQEEGRLRRQAQSDQNRSQIEAAKSERVAQLLKDMLKGVGPSVALGRDTTMLREILDQTAATICKELTNQPEVAIEMYETLAATYDDLGLDQKDEEMAREELQLGRVFYGSGHPALAVGLRRLAYALSNRGNLPEAESLAREAIAIERAIGPSPNTHLSDSLRTLGNVLWAKGELSDAEAAHRESLTLRRQTVIDDDPLLAESLNDLAGVLTMEGKLPEAEAMYRQALGMARRLFGEEHPTLAVSMNNLGSVLRREEKTQEAETMFREALALERKLLGDEHPNLAVSLNNLALLLRARGELKEAEALQRQALAIEKKSLGEHPQLAVSLRNLAGMLGEDGKLEEAEPLLRDAISMQQALAR